MANDDTAAGSAGIRDGVGGVWDSLGGCLEAADHGRGGGGLDFCKNGKKRAVRTKKIMVALNVLVIIL